MFTEEDNILSSITTDYSLTKNAGTLTMQLIAGHSDPSKMQVISFHPGVIHSAGWENAGVPKDLLPFDDSE